MNITNDLAINLSGRVSSNGAETAEVKASILQQQINAEEAAQELAEALQRQEKALEEQEETQEKEAEFKGLNPNVLER